MPDPKHLTDAEWSNFLADVGNAVYEATALVEDAEYRDEIVGNGHHVRQQIVEAARAVVDVHRPGGRDVGLQMAVDHLLRECERVRRERGR